MAAVLGMTALNTMQGFKSSSKAKKEARRAERAERLMTKEELRRLSIEQEQVLGSAKAQIAASGFTGYGANTQEYLTNLQTEQGKQKTFTSQVGASRASALRSQGEARSSAYQMDAYSSILQGAAKIGESFNWGLDETT